MSKITIGDDVKWNVRLKLYRQALGITQRHAAGLCGVGYRNYQRWEYGECMPSRRHRKKIAEVISAGVFKEDL